MWYNGGGKEEMSKIVFRARKSTVIVVLNNIGWQLFDFLISFA